jgi:integrase
MKGIYKMPGSKYLWFRWKEGGKRHAVSLKTDDEAVAIVKARAILAEGLGSTNYRDPLSAITDYLKAAQERRKKPMRPDTATRNRYILQKFVTDRELQHIGQITLKEIDEWINGFKKAGRSDDTLHTYARALHTFVKYLVRMKHVRGELLNDFDIPERAAVGRKNWLKNKEVERVISEAKDDTLRFVLFAGFHAGLRRNEVSNAKVGWFDLDAGLLHIQNDPASGFVLKDRENRSVPLTEAFKEFLVVFLANRNATEFAIRPEKEQASWRYRYDFNRLFQTHIKRCGVTCTVHDMRRSFASNLVSAGESIYIVARWLGDGVQVVERSYGHLAPSAGNINRLA